MALIDAALLAPEPLEDELAGCVDALFSLYPLLHGFSVQGPAALPESLRVPELEHALVLDVGVDPSLGQQYCDRVSDQVADVLRELVKARPEAAELLKDRTFARKMQ